jgi:hypothetical protein
MTAKRQKGEIAAVHWLVSRASGSSLAGQQHDLVVINKLQHNKP